MFLSYGYIKCIDHNSKTKLYRWEYKIIDSEFEEIEARVAGREVDVVISSAYAVAIDIYERRGLNVATNLVRAFIWQSKKYGWSISDMVKWNKHHNPKFAKYEEQISKYLILA